MTARKSQQQARMSLSILSYPDAEEPQLGLSLDDQRDVPETFLGIGYTKDRGGLPLEAVRVPVPRPGADQVLIRVVASSLNPLEYKLAELNFLGRTPPVILGFDLSGIVVATGSAVRGVAVGDAVVAMADLNGNGGWAVTGGGEGGYALAREFLTDLVKQHDERPDRSGRGCRATGTLTTSPYPSRR